MNFAAPHTVMPEAKKAALKILALDETVADAHAALGLAGQRHEALTILAKLERRRSHEYVGGTWLAWVNLGLGHHDQAVLWLQEAAE